MDTQAEQARDDVYRIANQALAAINDLKISSAEKWLIAGRVINVLIAQVYAPVLLEAAKLEAEKGDLCSKTKAT